MQKTGFFTKIIFFSIYFQSQSMVFKHAVCKIGHLWSYWQFATRISCAHLTGLSHLTIYRREIILYTLSTRVSVPSSELGPPPPASLRKRVVSPPLDHGGVYRGRLLGRNPDKSFKSFPPCYSHSPLQLCLDIYISVRFYSSVAYAQHMHQLLTRFA